MKVGRFGDFWSKVEKTDTCWLWRGSLRATGYGSVQYGGRVTEAHRVAYLLARGPIPEGLTLDHLCRVRSCVNPAHLEPVTNRVNVLRGFSPAAIHARQTHCAEGHEFTEANTYRHGGHRQCRACRATYARLYEQRVRRTSRYKPVAKAA